MFTGSSFQPCITTFREGFKEGHSWVLNEAQNTEPFSMRINFGILKLNHKQKLSDLVTLSSNLETVLVLLNGQIEVPSLNLKATRSSLFEQNATLVSLCSQADLEIDSQGLSEWAILQAYNPKSFKTKIIESHQIKTEYRGKGLANDTCLREVKLVFDKKNHPESELVVGEVVNYAGKWSSYPPHHHAQPEIYHYRFNLPQGYGHGEVGEDVFKIKNFDTLKIPGGFDHAQVSAPGYSMYYLWAVKHLESKPYTGFEFTKEHEWILKQT